MRKNQLTLLTPVAILAVAISITILGYAADYARVERTNVVHLGNVLFSGSQAMTQSTQALTTGALAVAAAGKDWIVLSADSNYTGITITGGKNGQPLILSSAATGSNTFRFDDNSNDLALGANITLTESEQDVLTVVCRNDAGTSWTRLYSSGN